MKGLLTISSQGDQQTSSTFYATNSSNKVWFLQLHDTIQMKSNYTWINYNHDNIAIRSHIVIYNFVWNFIFGTKFSSIYLAKGEKRLVFRLSFVNLQRAKYITHMFDDIYICIYIYICCINLIKSHSWYHTLLITFPNECLPCNKKMLLNLVAKMKFYTSFYIIKWLRMATI